MVVTELAGVSIPICPWAFETHELAGWDELLTATDLGKLCFLSHVTVRGLVTLRQGPYPPPI